ncbi:MAG: cupin domain-containing protein [Deltaproteobacteria bacterium]|nr:MAG: cupin domain-containing protein [Deltaproteobacteria bacterium]
MKIIDTEKIPIDSEYEKGFDIRFGVNDATCGAKKIVTGRTFLAPGGKNDPHYHANSEAVMYIMRGRIRVTAGTGDRKAEYVVGPGSFIYVPPGEVHGIVNDSDSEPADWIFMYPGVPNKEAAGTIIL